MAHDYKLKHMLPWWTYHIYYSKVTIKKLEHVALKFYYFSIYLLEDNLLPVLKAHYLSVYLLDDNLIPVLKTHYSWVYLVDDNLLPILTFCL